MADIAVEARQLKRSFNKGKFVAVNGLSLDIKYGQIHALLGPNRVGKTTTVKMLATSTVRQWYPSKSLAWMRLKTQPVPGVS